MSELVEVQTAELTGQALDWATGVADGLDIVVMANFKKPGHRVLLATPFTIERPGHPEFHDKSYRNWMPSTDWSQGGPLIQKHDVNLHSPQHCDDCWAAWVTIRGKDFAQGGYQPLVAACRAIVAAKLGEVVSVPKELKP